jgi:hypothetical protein
MGSVRTGHAQVFPKYKSTLSGFRQAVMQFVIPRRREGVSQFEKNVIPGEPKDCGRDPESRKVAKNRNILDPGSHPVSRDLAGMTNCDTLSRRGAPGRFLGLFHFLRDNTNLPRPLKNVPFCSRLSLRPIGPTPRRGRRRF